MGHHKTLKYMRYLIAVILLCVPAFADSNPNCVNNFISLQGVGTFAPFVNQLRVQANNASGTSTNYAVTAYIDGVAIPTPVTTSGGTAVFAMTTAVWAPTGIDPLDGRAHLLTSSIASPSFGTVQCNTGYPWPWKWLPSSTAADNTYPLYTNKNGGTLQDNTNTFYLVNYSDPDYYGTTGATTCPDGFGHAMFANGASSYYVAQHGIPCNHVHYMTGSVVQHYTIAQAATFMASITTPLDCTAEKFGVAGWYVPADINNISSTSLAGTQTNFVMDLAYYLGINICNGTNTIAVPEVIFQTSALREGDTTNTSNSGYAWTSVTDPTTVANFHPIGHFAGVNCTTGFSLCAFSLTRAKQLVDNAIAAYHTNPNGGKVLCGQAGGFIANACPNMSSPTLTGTNTGVAPNSLNVVVSTPSNPSPTVTTTGILALMSPVAMTQNSTPGWICAGCSFGIQTLSFPGDLGNTSQNSVGWFIGNFGAEYSCGSNFEPVGTLPRKYPDFLSMISGLTRGQTYLEATTHTMLQPGFDYCGGDPMTQPFSNSFAQPTPTFYIF